MNKAVGNIAEFVRQIKDPYRFKCGDFTVTAKFAEGVLFDRPAFQEMMEDIKAGTINCVIVKDLSRLGREYIETGRYLRRILATKRTRTIKTALLLMKLPRELCRIFSE